MGFPPVTPREGKTTTYPVVVVVDVDVKVLCPPGKAPKLGKPPNPGTEEERAGIIIGESPNKFAFLCLTRVEENVSTDSSASASSSSSRRGRLGVLLGRSADAVD